MNDPQTQARILAHLLAHRPERLVRKPVHEQREDEESTTKVLSDEWIDLLKRFGRTVPADTPPLPEAEARYLRLGPRPGDAVLTIELCVMLARARLREGLWQEAREPLRRAQRLLAQIGHLPEEEQEHHAAVLRSVEAHVKMARGRFPSLPWEINDVHEQIAVPDPEWPQMILQMCWIAYRLGEQGPPMALAERLREAVGRSGEAGIEELVELFGEGRRLMIKAEDDLLSRAGRKRPDRDA